MSVWKSVLNDESSPRILALGMHFVGLFAWDDSDSSRLMFLPRVTKCSTFCGVTFGTMPSQAGFVQADFKPCIPETNADIIILDYFWMQRGGNWVQTRYGGNWYEKAMESFDRNHQLKIVLLPNRQELISSLEGKDAQSKRKGDGLTFTFFSVEDATRLHPLVIATIARDDMVAPEIFHWQKEGRLHDIQISRYAPDGFMALHRFENSDDVVKYLHSVNQPRTADLTNLLVHCPKGHLMTLNKSIESFKCDVCRVVLRDQCDRFSCHACDHDICSFCAPTNANSASHSDEHKVRTNDVDANKSED